MTLNPFALAGILVRQILPDPVVAALERVVESIEKLLQGDPARAIGYGAAVVIYLVANAVGRIPDMTFDQAISAGVTAVTVLVGIVEAIRHYVFSPRTVAQLTGANAVKKVSIDEATAIVVEPKGAPDA